MPRIEPSRFYEHLSKDMSGYPYTGNSPPGFQDHPPRSVMDMAADLRKQTQTPGSVSVYSQDGPPSRDSTPPPVPAIPVDLSTLAGTAAPISQGSLHRSDVEGTSQHDVPSIAPQNFDLDEELDAMIDSYGTKSATPFNMGQDYSASAAESKSATSDYPPRGSSLENRSRPLKANEPPMTQSEMYSDCAPAPLSPRRPTKAERTYPTPVSEPGQAEYHALEARRKRRAQEDEERKRARDARRAQEDEERAKARDARRARTAEVRAAANDSRLNSPVTRNFNVSARPTDYAAEYAKLRETQRNQPASTSTAGTPKRPSLAKIGRKLSGQAKKAAQKTFDFLEEITRPEDNWRNFPEQVSIPRRPSISAPFRPQHDFGPDNAFDRSNPISRPATELARSSRRGSMTVRPLDTNQFLAGQAQKHYHSNDSFVRSQGTPGSTEPSPAAAAHMRREVKREAKREAKTAAQLQPAPRKVKTVGHPDRGTVFGDFINVSNSSSGESVAKAPAPAPAPSKDKGRATLHDTQARTPTTQKHNTVCSNAATVVNQADLDKSLPATPESSSSYVSAPSDLVLTGRLAGRSINRPHSQITQQVLDHVPIVPRAEMPAVIADAHAAKRIMDERPVPNAGDKKWGEPELTVDTYFGPDGRADVRAVYRPVSSNGSEVSIRRYEYNYDQPNNLAERAEYERKTAKNMKWL